MFFTALSYMLGFLFCHELLVEFPEIAPWVIGASALIVAVSSFLYARAVKLYLAGDPKFERTWYGRYALREVEENKRKRLVLEKSLNNPDSVPWSEVRSAVSGLKKKTVPECMFSTLLLTCCPGFNVLLLCLIAVIGTVLFTLKVVVVVEKLLSKLQEKK